MVRRGTTLIEIIIAMSIFTVLITAVLQCLTGVRGFVDRESVQNDLVLEGRRLIDLMVQDLSGAAWYVPPPASGGPNEVTTGGFASATQTELQIPARDRAIKYYPYIMTQEPTGRGGAFAAFWRTPAGVVDPATLPLALPAAHRWASQEIVFVKIATAPAALTPRTIQPPPAIVFQQTNPEFTGGATMAGWNKPPRVKRAYNARNLAGSLDATTWSLGIITDGAGAVVDLPVLWESSVATPNPNEYREYGYVVVPNPVSGRAQLERHYRNASDASAANPAQLDVVLSRNVDRLVVNTYRTDATLGVDQIRVTIYLSRALDDGTLITDVVEATAAMRSIFNAMGPVGIQQRLGEAGTFTAPVVTP